MEPLTGVRSRRPARAKIGKPWPIATGFTTTCRSSSRSWMIRSATKSAQYAMNPSASSRVSRMPSTVDWTCGFSFLKAARLPYP